MDFTGYYWVFYWVSLLLFSAKDSVFIGRFLFRFSFVFLFVCFICLFFLRGVFLSDFSRGMARFCFFLFDWLVGRRVRAGFFSRCSFVCLFFAFFYNCFFFVHRMGHHRHVASLERAEPVPANVVCG